MTFDVIVNLSAPFRSELPSAPYTVHYNIIYEASRGVIYASPPPIRTAPSAGLDPRGYGLVEGILIAVVLSSLIVFAVAGNVLVVVAVLTDRRLRRTSNFFIVSLAVADALVALLVMTFSVVNEVHGSWLFGAAFCSVWLSSDVMCSTASITNLCAISLDRYVHIRSPLHYDAWVTRDRTLAAIAGVWLLSALISFLPIHLGWHRLGEELSTSAVAAFPRESDVAFVSGFSDVSGASGFSGVDVSGVDASDVSYSGAFGKSGLSGLSSMDLSGVFGLSGVSGLSGSSGQPGVSSISGGSGFSGQPDETVADTRVTAATAAAAADSTYTCALDLNPYYAVVSSTVSFYAPCVMMLAIYVRLYRYARGHVRSIKALHQYHLPRASLPALQPLAGRDASGLDVKSRLSEHKAAVTLGVIMGVFLCCWAPFFTANVIGAWCPSCVPPSLFSIFTWLGYLNSTMNPVIYGVFNQEFSAAFRRVLGLGGPRGGYLRGSSGGERRASERHWVGGDASLREMGGRLERIGGDGGVQEAQRLVGETGRRGKENGGEQVTYL